MPFLPQDGQYLDRALRLAEDAAAYASPNPTVGCVLVSAREGQQPRLLGEGAHRYDARDHAEVVALKAAAAAGHGVRGGTAYVTLEPCAHHGRTGPCADALITAGIARCVVATVDPNPLVRGQGIARMRAAGVAVEVLAPDSTEATRARRLNDAFAFAIQFHRPFVTLKTAVSRDGKLAPAPARRQDRSPFWLTGTAAREDVQRLRHGTDALLTGIGTALADNPSLTDRSGQGRRRPLLRAVLDAKLRVPLDSTLVVTATQDLLLFASEAALPEREEALRALGADILRVPAQNGCLDLQRVLAALGAAGMRSVLLEAGPTLNAAFLTADLVDAVVIYTAPAVLGPEALPFAGAGTLGELQARLTQPAVASFLNGDAEDERLTGYLHDPWQGVLADTGPR